MSAFLSVSANERGVLRLFALDDQLCMEIADAGALDHLYLALGTERLHDPDVQIVQLCTIADMGLPAFLQDAYDIDPAELTPLTNTLKALSGTIALLRSGAFNSHALHLSPSDHATLIATFTEPQTVWSAKPMTPTPLARPSPRAARTRARHIGLSLFSGMMALILLLVLWLAT
ncbi:MAG: hypothetical protein L3J36_08795 [Rhodobacteraceae bacterium]|nr:hypothetical protein [Paracoccaceae bacterium]